MTSNRLRLAVGIPAYGDALTAWQARMWMEFGSTLGGSEKRFELVMFSHVDTNPIDKARNMLLDQAVEHKADWLLMIDADTWVESNNSPDALDAGALLLRMISEADRAGASIVAAPVMRRDMEPHDAMIYRLPYGQRWDMKLEHVDRSIWFDGKTPLEIDAAATAVFAINISEIKRTRRWTYELPRFAFNGALSLSEDFDFCRQVREAGGKILCDPRVRTGHKSRPFAIYSS